jgi:hypothetical protein
MSSPPINAWCLSIYTIAWMIGEEKQTKVNLLNRCKNIVDRMLPFPGGPWDVTRKEKRRR